MYVANGKGVPETLPKAYPGGCQGEVIGDEEADAIKQKRKQYIQGVLSKSLGGKLQGKRLVLPTCRVAMLQRLQGDSRCWKMNATSAGG